MGLHFCNIYSLYALWTKIWLRGYKMGEIGIHGKWVVVTLRSNLLAHIHAQTFTHSQWEYHSMNSNNDVCVVPDIHRTHLCYMCVCMYVCICERVSAMHFKVEIKYNGKQWLRIDYYFSWLEYWIVELFFHCIISTLKEKEGKIGWEIHELSYDGILCTYFTMMKLWYLKAENIVGKERWCCAVAVSAKMS